MTKDQLKPIVLILRFRDLSPPVPGFTIAEHGKIIAKDGYAWWGWWKKQSEEIPIALWSELKKQVRAGSPARAFLLDSGQRKLYETAIFDLEFDNGGGYLKCPEGGAKTPPYYNPPDNPTAFATWFKIGPIKEVTDNELAELMYRNAPHDDLVAADMDTLVGLKIGRISDLLQFGNITYWVVTPASPDARPARRQLSAKTLSPVAPKEIIRAESARILHITDLHVARGKHAFPIGPSDAHNISLPDALFQALKNERLPGAVIVSGDLTWTGSKEEFDLAFDCLDGIRSTLGLTHQHFVIIPGNHDMRWTPSKDGDYYDWNAPVSVASEEARRNYVHFFERWYGAKPNDWLSIGRRLFLVGGPTVDIVGLNSSALQQTEGYFAGIGRITERAYSETAEAMGWSKDPRAVRATSLRILAVHHHVLPVVASDNPAATKKGFGIALDAENQLIASTAYGVDLIVHGHQHHPYIGFTQRELLLEDPLNASKGILVLGGGSAGVVDEELGPIKQRCFNLIHLAHDSVRVELFSTPAKRDEFKKATGAVVARYGHPWRRE